MSPRLHIASLIYAQLVLQDLRASAENPTRNAHKALMFADALIMCDQQAAHDFMSDRDDRHRPQLKPPATTPSLASRVFQRREDRSKLH